uniref:Uncharacterized protein n=1 Tax=Arundo donax TaxID=35708 RepID=A0A0A9BQS9_ARUDO
MSVMVPEVPMTRCSRTTSFSKNK